MKLIFIGSGSAFTIGSDNFQSNMLLENDAQQKLLIDCGSDARWALFEQGLTYKDINHVYISHLHADHVGGLEWLAFTRKFDTNCDNATLYIHEKKSANFMGKGSFWWIKLYTKRSANFVDFF